MERIDPQEKADTAIVRMVGRASIAMSARPIRHAML